MLEKARCGMNHVWCGNQPVILIHAALTRAHPVHKPRQVKKLKMEGDSRPLTFVLSLRAALSSSGFVQSAKLISRPNGAATFWKYLFVPSNKDREHK